MPGYHVAEHHELLADRLEAVERGELRRLMVFMPPRHGKSELASRRFPAWYLGRNPSNNIIGTSYNQDLATDFGRDVRNIVDDPEYRRIFKMGLRPDSQAANRWNTDKDGAYFASGVAGSLTGRGGDVLLVDDPIKDRKEADSETVRDGVWDWYRSTLRTRLEKNGSIIIIQTRWHEDDLAGRVLNSKRGGDFEVLSLPAINDEGEPLWPWKFSLEALEELKDDVGAREWSALYQQQPQPDDGTFFKREWFNRFNADNPPRHLNIYTTSDYAVSEGDGDYTEHAVWGVDPERNIYLLDGWYGQTASNVWIDELLRLVQEHKPFACFGEKGVIEKAVNPFLQTEMERRKIFARMEWIPSIVDKATRARAFQGMASSGKVFIPDNDYGNRALSQLLTFPTGKFDDFVDTASLMGMVLDQAHAAIVTDQTAKPKQDRWKRKRTSSGSNWA